MDTSTGHEDEKEANGSEQEAKVGYVPDPYRDALGVELEIASLVESNRPLECPPRPNTHDYEYVRYLLMLASHDEFCGIFRWSRTIIDYIESWTNRDSIVLSMAEDGNAIAQFDVAERLYEKGTEREALVWYRRSAEGGYEPAWRRVFEIMYGPIPEVVHEPPKDDGEVDDRTRDRIINWRRCPRFRGVADDLRNQEPLISSYAFLQPWTGSGRRCR